MNHGLVLISPLVLVRLLPVETFGQYREFLLYTTLLTSFAAFGVSSSLLRFVPHALPNRQSFIDHAVVLTLLSSTVVASGVALLHMLAGGALLGEHVVPALLYVLFFVNFDYWEHLWLAEKRIGAVFGYTSGRLIARMSVVISVSALTRDIDAIVWSLVSLEALRLTVFFTVWLRGRASAPARAPGLWREQLKFCLPVGAALVLNTLNKSIGSLFVVRMMGPVALAHYSVGTYVQPIIAVMRNSLSDVMLPEISSRVSAGASDPLRLWRRMTIMAAIFLVAAAVVLERFAESIVVTLFSADYLAAVPVFQIYLLVLIREIFDFAVPLRTINRTAPLMYSNSISILINMAIVVLLLPVVGTPGAAIAFVAARTFEGIYLGWSTARTYSLRLRQLVQWSDLAKVFLSAAAASLVIVPQFWSDHFGLFGLVVGSMCFLAVYFGLLLLLRVPEARTLMEHLRRLPRLKQVRLRNDRT